MLKKIIVEIKKKAEKDDNKYWERQEQYIQRKECKASIGEKMIFFACGMAFTSIVYLVI